MNVYRKYEMLICTVELNDVKNIGGSGLLYCMLPCYTPNAWCPNMNYDLVKILTCN